MDRNYMETCKNVPGLFVNCGKYPFIDWMFKRSKPFETRSRNVLKSITEQCAAVIETGKNRSPVVRGYVYIGKPFRVEYDNVKMRKKAKIYGTEYDIKPGKFKWFYPVRPIRKVSPYQLPKERENHGRSFTRFVIKERWFQNEQ